MLAKIGNFVFDFNNKDIDSISHQLNIGWDRQQRQGNHTYTQKSGTWEEETTFKGKLVLKSVRVLDDFENAIKEGKPIRLTLGTGESYEVAIDNLTRTKSGFLRNGGFRFQEYSIKMQRYFK